VTTSSYGSAPRPYSHELGIRWQQGSISVAQEHFASNVVRGRLMNLARGWGDGNGPLAILACAPEELHDLALLVFRIVLNRKGWRVGYLGVSTPLDDVMTAAAELHPDLVASPLQYRSDLPLTRTRCLGWPALHRWPWPEQVRRSTLPTPSVRGCSVTTPSPRHNACDQSSATRPPRPTALAGRAMLQRGGGPQCQSYWHRNSSAKL
jgi:hypothetical protein